MTSKEAAIYLGYAENTLREARVKGILAGVQAPPYIIMGKRIEHEKVDLDTWKAQFRTMDGTSAFRGAPEEKQLRSHLKGRRGFTITH